MASSANCDGSGSSRGESLARASMALARHRSASSLLNFSKAVLAQVMSAAAARSFSGSRRDSPSGRSPRSSSLCNMTLGGYVAVAHSVKPLRDAHRPSWNFAATARYHACSDASTSHPRARSLSRWTDEDVHSPWNFGRSTRLDSRDLAPLATIFGVTFERSGEDVHIAVTHRRCRARVGGLQALGRIQRIACGSENGGLRYGQEARSDR